MTKIIGFFTSLIDVFVALLNMVINFIQSIIWLTLNLPELLAGVTASFSYVPAFVLPFLTVSLSIMVVLMVIRLL